MFIENTFISVHILSQLIVPVISSLMILYLTVSVNFYPRDGQDWLHFGFKTHHIAVSSIIPHRFNDFNYQDFNHYLFLNYIFIIYAFST